LLADDGMTSHFDWKDNSRILAWARRRWSIDWKNRSHFFKLLRGQGNDFYFLFEDQTSQAEIVGKGILISDGHCSYSPDRTWILTDTYPDRDSMRTLILYHEKDRRRVDIGRFHSLRGLKSEIRCDLHPRWSRNGRMVNIDSTHTGSRQMYVIDVKSIVA
jgi:hypothetical protein